MSDVWKGNGCSLLYKGTQAQENTQLSLQRGLVSVVLYWLGNLMTGVASVSLFSSSVFPVYL